MTGLIVCPEYNAQITLSGIAAMDMARLKHIVIKHTMFVNSFTMNAVKTAQIHSWWYVEIARIDPTHRNSDPPRTYILVVNESSERLFSLLTLCSMHSQRLLASLLIWYTAV